MNMDHAEEIAGGLRSVAHAIMPIDASRGDDANGGYVSSLTESVMGVSAGLSRIASALESIAEAIRERP